MKPDSEKVEKQEEKPLVLLLCRLSQSAHRASSLQLFAIQGYFLAISKDSDNLKQIVQSLHKALNNEEERILLDGFIAYGSARQHWQFCYFGKELAMNVDGANLRLSSSASLGSEEYTWKPAYHFNKPGRIELSIRDYHLLTLEKLS